MGAQLSWESICLTSRGSQVRVLLFPPFGPVVQLVRTLACHARGRRFEPVPGRQILPLQLSRQSRGLKIPVSMVRFRPEAPKMRMQLIWQSATLPRWRQRVRAPSSAPIKTLVSQVLFYSQQIDNLICIFESLQTETKATITKWEHSSAGRASALQAEGHRFESYCSHHIWPGSSVGQNASLSRQRSTVRTRSGSPIFCLCSSVGRAGD